MDNQLAAVIPYEEIAARLRESVEDARGAYAANSDRAYASDKKLFAHWCLDRGITPIPATPETVRDFIDDMASSRKPASIRRYVASISRYHREAKLESPTSSVKVRFALKRMCKEKGTRQNQARALNREHVNSMLFAAGDALKDLRDRALLSMAYDTMARRSELVGLDVTDLTIAEDGSGTVLIRKSKGDQEGAGSVRYVAADTVAALTRWLTTSGVDDGALFRSVMKGGRVGGRLDGGTVSRIFKRLASAVGLEPQGISGHSTRVGTAQDMVKHGFGVAEILQSGGWKTPAMLARYTERLSARNGAAAKLANIQNRI